MTSKATATKAKASAKPTDVTANRRSLETRRFQIRRSVTPGDALKNASTPTEVLKALKRKAEEFTDAVFLELGLTAKTETSRVVQLALFQDFIEVHNAAVARISRLPEDSRDADKLLG